MTYTQHTSTQRYQIFVLLKIGQKQHEIAQVIGVHPAQCGVHKSTISRDLIRNRGLRGYRPHQAQTKAEKRRKHRVRHRIGEKTWDEVKRCLRLEWSPEQISGWFRKTKKETVSHEWIYQYIYQDKRAGGELWKHLRIQKRKRKWYGSPERRGSIPDRV